MIRASSNENDIVADFFCVRKGMLVLKAENDPTLSSLPDIGEGTREGLPGKELKSGVLAPVRITKIQEHITEEQVFDIEVQDAHSFITETCVIHNCGSGNK